MKWTRYEILLPLRYNDGLPIESAKFDQTNLELVDKFSATTTDMITAIGSWKYQGTPYEDQLLRLIVDLPGQKSCRRFLQRLQRCIEGPLPAN